MRIGAGDGGVAIEVSDDGGGFDSQTRPGEGSYGLEIMSKRARMLDGELRLTSSPGRGTKVAVRLPGSGA